MGLIKKIFGYSNDKSFKAKEILAPNDTIKEVPIHRRNKERIVNKIVEIDAGKYVGSFRDCYFKDCEIRIRCAAKYTFAMTESCAFDNCLIWAHTKQSGGNWSPKFTNCKFKGRYELRFENKLMKCDFSEAKLSIVSLLSNDNYEDIKGVYFPNIALIDAKENLKEWESIAKPSDFKDLVWASAIEAKSIVLINISEFTSEPDQLWQEIKGLSFVRTSFLKE